MLLTLTGVVVLPLVTFVVEGLFVTGATTLVALGGDLAGGVATVTGQVLVV
jgi:hypothetical protein